MDAKTYFDFYEYMFKTVHENKLAEANQFETCYCNGLGDIPAVLAKFRTRANFVAAFDTCEGSTRQDSGGWHQKRLLSVVIIARHRKLNVKDRAEKMAMCRELFRQFKTKIIHDRRIVDDLRYLDVASIRSKELGHLFPETCGLLFTLTQEEPEDLRFNNEEWITK